MRHQLLAVTDAEHGRSCGEQLRVDGGASGIVDAGRAARNNDAAGTPVLGICYGQQLMAHLLGGNVQKGDRGEYGFAHLDITSSDGILRGIETPAGLDEPLRYHRAARRIQRAGEAQKACAMRRAEHAVQFRVTHAMR